MARSQRLDLVPYSAHESKIVGLVKEKGVAA
jgi:hypothetical protein